ncbi:hypothetical protein OMAG_001433 [Candidatus Omnitrophus magneticus]|uniref:Uncharacterized protein n=1 Tax=Candidatus Omnitrophus magneticus TaxID=1609969 RepID=A0A0F0CT37_9BACT|nr:hypothetical protein OMAG_002509 [Candidatus Omnitrophus magneticus]KJJ83678.1 hypothetical protein OMAG_002458 [Candidatus Omnitrophus magneticus]KJJ84425.1 hypothetical protein OMAG_001706 [Candidatus Omnitrophus magneticus]KJJ84686.1 hypothetical protein OMAG_001445 [Candidatus Omnitrophus magneticus]KJJ84697.1 hypothetical protein OMAG_001433 [Candidatus Omnitrophus magneticus]
MVPSSLIFSCNAKFKTLGIISRYISFEKTISYFSFRISPKSIT